MVGAPFGPIAVETKNKGSKFAHFQSPKGAFSEPHQNRMLE